MLSARFTAVSVGFSLIALAALFACRKDDPGFEVVRVPLSAYASADAALRDDAHVVDTSDGGPSPIVLCVPLEQAKKDEDSDECAEEFHDRSYDEKATTRHRAKGDDSTVCCYRRGRVLPRGHRDDGD